MKSRTRIVNGEKYGKRTAGVLPSTYVWGRLMICQCGKRFNVHYDGRGDRKEQLGLQCYTSTNFGSQASRIKKGMSLEGTCSTPHIVAWRMQLMADEIFKRYISNGDELMELAYGILEKQFKKHVSTTANIGELINAKLDEIDRCRKKIDGLIEMRVDGDIDRDAYKSKKKDLDNRIVLLEDEIASLQKEKPEEIPQDYTNLLIHLRRKLESYVDLGEGPVPEFVIEAFICRIWVSADEFRWYLRTDATSDDPNDKNHVKIGEFTITYDEALAYQRKKNPRTRIFNWRDLNVSVWV